MHPFSIEYLTSPEVGRKKVQPPSSPESVDSGTPRTPSPTSSDSSIESPFSAQLRQRLDSWSRSPDNASSSYSSPSSTHSGPTVDSSVAEALRLLENHAASNISTKRANKPSQSYIAMISMAILNSPDRKMILSDIYQHIMDSFPYYNNQDKAWRNSVRHNLSLNECFIKCGRAENGKGNFWAIHPACVEDFSRGDFRRRQARRRARRSDRWCLNTGQFSEMSGNVKCNPVYTPVSPSETFTGYHPYSTPYWAQQQYPMMSSPSTTLQETGYLRYSQEMITPSLVPSSSTPFLPNGFGYSSLPAW